MLERSIFSSQLQKSMKVYSYCIRGSRFSQSPNQFSQSMEKYKAKVFGLLLLATRQKKINVVVIKKCEDEKKLKLASFSYTLMPFCIKSNVPGYGEC